MALHILLVSGFGGATWDYIRETIANTVAATAADAGIVRIQAHKIWPAIPHLTAERRRVEPTPTMAPVMV
jgi:hypothetical protein